MCDCYVQHLNEEARFSLHLGAHNPTCPAYRVSRDSVDRAHDEAFRAGRIAEEASTQSGERWMAANY